MGKKKKRNSKPYKAGPLQKGQGIEFKFDGLDRIGTADAADDSAFLDACFVDVGYLRVLKSIEDPRRIVIGRTGAGKTALLRQMQASCERAFAIAPEDLALSYISNSTVLRHWDSNGVHLESFFKLLWKHVLAVELLRHRFELEQGAFSQNWWQRQLSRFSDKSKQRSLEYLRKWGAEFWKDSTYKVTEITIELERQLEAAVGHEAVGQAKAGTSAKETQKKELVHQAQKIINEVQIKDLASVMQLLDEVLDDPQKPYFIVIDRLDEEWVEDPLRFKLIRALIETLNDFRDVRHAKIIVALRDDLLDSVIEHTRRTGFQREKYESIQLRLSWQPSQLIDIVDRRITALVRRRYTKKPVALADIIVPKIDRKPSTQWLIDRTLLRPRDVISFINCALKRANERHTLTARTLREAEAEYSRARLNALYDEWSAIYPNLKVCVERLLRGRPSGFSLSDIRAADLESCVEVLLPADPNPARPQDQYWPSFSSLAVAYYRNDLDASTLRFKVTSALYKVGLLLVKTETTNPYVSSSEVGAAVLESELRADSKIRIHPAFYRSLGIRTN